MQITLTREQVKEAFGELRFMGADNCYRYDKDSKKKTEEVEALKLHLGSMKLGNSVDIRLEATELPKIEPYAVVELEEVAGTIQNDILKEFTSSEKRKQKVYKKLNLLLQNEYNCANIQSSSEITELKTTS